MSKGIRTPGGIDSTETTKTLITKLIKEAARRGATELLVSLPPHSGVLSLPFDRVIGLTQTPDLERLVESPTKEPGETTNEVLLEASSKEKTGAPEIIFLHGETEAVQVLPFLIGVAAIPSIQQNIEDLKIIIRNTLLRTDRRSGEAFSLVKEYAQEKGISLSTATSSIIEEENEANNFGLWLIEKAKKELPTTPPPLPIEPSKETREDMWFLNSGDEIILDDNKDPFGGIEEIVDKEWGVPTIFGASDEEDPLAKVKDPDEDNSTDDPDVDEYAAAVRKTKRTRAIIAVAVLAVIAGVGTWKRDAIMEEVEKTKLVLFKRGTPKEPKVIPELSQATTEEVVAAILEPILDVKDHPTTTATAPEPKPLSPEKEGLKARTAALRAKMQERSGGQIPKPPLTQEETEEEAAEQKAEVKPEQKPQVDTPIKPAPTQETEPVKAPEPAVASQTSPAGGKLSGNSEIAQPAEPPAPAPAPKPEVKPEPIPKPTPKPTPEPTPEPQPTIVQAPTPIQIQIVTRTSSATGNTYLDRKGSEKLWKEEGWTVVKTGGNYILRKATPEGVESVAIQENLRVPAGTKAVTTPLFIITTTSPE